MGGITAGATLQRDILIQLGKQQGRGGKKAKYAHAHTQQVEAGAVQAVEAVLKELNKS